VKPEKFTTNFGFGILVAAKIGIHPFQKVIPHRLKLRIAGNEKFVGNECASRY